jgi:hypothetical protein
VRATAVATKSVSGTMAELKAQKKWVAQTFIQCTFYRSC